MAARSLRPLLLGTGNRTALTRRPVSIGLDIWRAVVRRRGNRTVKLIRAPAHQEGYTSSLCTPLPPPLDCWCDLAFDLSADPAEVTPLPPSPFLLRLSRRLPVHFTTCVHINATNPRSRRSRTGSRARAAGGKLRGGIRLRKGDRRGRGNTSHLKRQARSSRPRRSTKESRSSSSIVAAGAALASSALRVSLGYPTVNGFVLEEKQVCSWSNGCCARHKHAPACLR